MGRRKIAIQPITRKTGLFKKAYELGVLCSVDVAVIIFERKHGHPDKLFQYCSTDIDALVQRQIRFDGDRDLRTPHDFVGGANLARLDDVGDDDDDVDADDPPTGRPYLRHDGTKGKSIPESGKPWGPKPESPSEVDYRPRLHLPAPAPTSSPTLPVSADRHTNQSRPRLPSSSSSYPVLSPNPRKRVKIDDHSSTVPSPISSTFPTHPNPGPQPPPPPPSQQQQPHPNAYQSGFFPGFDSSHLFSPTLQHGNALHTPASFPSPPGSGFSSGGPGGGGGGSGGGGGGPPLHLVQTAAAGVAGYGSSRHNHPPRITQPHFAPSTEELFASVFGPAGGSGVGLDPEFGFLAPPLTFEWPQFAAPTTHAGGAGGNHHPQPQQTTATTSTTTATTSAGGESSSSSSWLDFLSGAASDAPRSPRSSKRSRGETLGSSAGAGESEEGEGAYGPGGRNE